MPQAAPTSMGYHSCDCIEEGFNIQQTGIEGDRMSASDVSSVPIVTNQSHPSAQIRACPDPESSAAPSRAAEPARAARQGTPRLGGSQTLSEGQDASKRRRADEGQGLIKYVLYYHHWSSAAVAACASSALHSRRTSSCTPASAGSIAHLEGRGAKGARCLLQLVSRSGVHCCRVG